MQRFGVAAVLAGAIILAYLSPWSATQTVYVGGPVLTMDAENRIAEGIAVEGDEITAVGSELELRAWAAENGADVVELDGRALLPGFIDAHGHFPGEGLYALHANLNSPPLGPVETIDDIVTALADHAAGVPAGEWVIGISYDDSLLAEKRHPTRHDLDRASRDHRCLPSFPTV